MLIHPDIARKLTGMLRPTRPKSAELEQFGLTPAEKKVVVLIAEGLSNKEIAGQLYLSEGTVKNYVTEILGKLNLRDRTQIAIFILKRCRASSIYTHFAPKAGLCPIGQRPASSIMMNGNLFLQNRRSSSPEEPRLREYEVYSPAA